MSPAADVIAVDWSGARTGAGAHIWLARAEGGVIVELSGGRGRDDVVDDLISRRRSCPDGLIVGLDFAFSFPAWFVRQLGCADVGALWATAEREGEGWLADCALPFWGRPGRPRPELPEHLRQCDRLATVGGISAKSVFQIGGAGAVGTGSIRGMPHLRRLREAGFSIWPFDPPSPWTVVEIYPRLLTGPVRKSSLDHRSRYLADAPWSLDTTTRRLLECSEDAFDAAVSALVMDRHAGDLAVLGQSSDPAVLLEGDVWRPPTIGS